MKTKKWESKPISATCEVVDYPLCDAARRLCGAPTTHVYPAMGGGYMALCREHSRTHREAWPLAEVDEVVTF